MQIYIAEWPNSKFGKISWRSLNWNEVRKFDADLIYLPAQVVNNSIYTTVVLNGPDLEVVTAGIVQYIVDTVFTASALRGFLEPAKFKLTQKRKELSTDYLKQMSTLIASKFNYTFEEIDKWDENTLFERIAQLELLEGKDLTPLTVDEVNNKGKHKPSNKRPSEGTFGERF